MAQYIPRHAAPRNKNISKHRAAALSLTALLSLSMAPATANETAPLTENSQAVQEAEVLIQEALTDRGNNPADIYKAAPETLVNETFYDAPAHLPTANGALIKKETFSFKVDANNIIAHPVAQAQRIMYKSTDHQGNPVAVTGTALTTTKPWGGPGERPIIALAPGTQGIGDSCAPSNQFGAGSEYESLVITALLNAGYNVVVTDYIGLGTEGTHSYLNRVDQGNAVLDAARAATATDLGLGSRTSPIGLWGYSQGGGAVASAGELQASYAPELNLKGIYAGAVPADLQAVTTFIDGGLYTGFSLMGVAGLADSYGLDLSDKLSAEGQAALEAVRHQCTGEAITTFGFKNTRILTASGQTLAQEMMTDPQIAHIVAQNNLGQQGRHPQVPILIASSWADDVIPYQTNRQLAADYCQQGADVTFYTLAGVGHAPGIFEGIPGGLIFMDRQFKELPNINSCWQF
ncbi:lipase family protein [Rothia sp. 88186D007BW]